MRMLMVMLIASQQTYAGDNDRRFRHLSADEGLSQSTVSALLQGSRGYLWIGTWDGLNRYDGYEFAVYRHIPGDSTSLSDNTVHCLFEDRAGTLWIGTADGLNALLVDTRTGIARERFEQYRSDSTSGGLSGSDIRSIYQDRAGTLWVGSSAGLDSGVLIPGTRRYRFRPVHPDPGHPQSRVNRNITSIVEDSTGALWFGSLGGGVIRYDRQSFHLFSRDPETPQGISSNFVMTLFCDRKGSIWVGTYGGGLNLYDAATGKFTTFVTDSTNAQSIADNHVYSVVEDDEGFLWVGTFGGGLNRFDRHTFLRYRNDDRVATSLSSDFVRAVKLDRSRNLWVATNKGLNVLDLKPEKFHSYSFDPLSDNCLGDNNVLSFAETFSGTDGSIVWIGTNKGLDRLDRETETFTHYRLLHSTPKSREGFVYALCEDRSGTLWAGTFGGGLYRQNARNGSFTQYIHSPENPGSIPDNRVTALLQPHDDMQLLVGTVVGLSRFDPATGLFSSSLADAGMLTLEGTRVTAMLEARNGVIWVGTAGGLVRIDRASGTIQRFAHDPATTNSLSHNSIGALFEDKEGILWIGTDLGLDRMDPATATFGNYTTADGLPNNQVTTIVGDDRGNLWLTTNRGLTRFNPGEARFRNFDIADGIRSSEFNSGAWLVSRSGEVFLGGVSGVTLIHPDRVVDNPYPPAVVITAFDRSGVRAASGLSLPATESIELSYDDRFFSFEFASLDFTAPGKNRYAYMLEGFDQSWIDAGTRRFAGFTSIDAGTYTFRVRATNNDGIWNNDGASIAIHVLPPFWETWWFRLLIIASIIGAATMLYRYRVSRLLEIERTRHRIARDLHDEVGGTLSSISNFAQAIRNESAGDSSRLLALIAESSAQAQEAMSDIIWSINPGNDGWDALFAKCTRYASDLCESRTIRHHIVMPAGISSDPLNLEHRRHFWLLYKELVTNAVKHSGCTDLTVELAVAGESITLVVADNGKGFDPGTPKDGNGLKNIRTRAAALHAHLDLQTARGTRWELHFTV